MGRGPIRTDDSIPLDPSATGTDNRSLLGYYALPALPGLLTVTLAGQTIGGADRFRAEHAFPSWIARALETHVAAKSENSIVSFDREISRGNKGSLNAFKTHVIKVSQLSEAKIDTVVRSIFIR